MGTQLPLPKQEAETPIFGPCPWWPNGWMDQDMALRTEVGLGQVHIVLDGYIVPLPKKGPKPPIFGPSLLWPNGWMHQDATWYGGRHQPRRHCVRWGPSPLPQNGQRLTRFLAHVYCGQTTAWIKMPLGTEVGLGLRDVVFDVDPATPRKKEHTHPTQFLSHVYCGQMAGWMTTPLGAEVDLGPGHIVLDGILAPAKRGTAASSFRLMSIVATVAHLSYC